MPKRKAPKGCFWRGNTLWGRIQANGADVKWSLRTDDPATALSRRKAEHQRQIAATRYGDQRRTWQEVFEAWERFIVDEVSGKTVTRYASSLSVLQPYLDGLYLDEIDKKLVGSIVEARQRTPHIPKGKKKAIKVTNATIKRDLTALSSVLGYAVDQEWREDNPVLSWLRPQMRRKSRIRERRDPIVLPTSEDVEKVIARAPGNFATLIMAARKTGCRLDELVSARRTQVHHSRKQLTVVGKRNKQRTIDLDGWGYDDVFKSIPASLASPWLFWHHDGEPFKTASGRFRAMVASVAKKEQKQEHPFRPFRFHDLRHLHAVEWLKSGKSIYDLQHRLGHTSIQTTEMYLAYLTPEEAQVARQAGTKTGT